MHANCWSARPPPPSLALLLDRATLTAFLIQKGLVGSECLCMKLDWPARPLIAPSLCNRFAEMKLIIMEVTEYLWRFNLKGLESNNRPGVTTLHVYVQVMTQREVKWVDAYHREVWKKASPRMQDLPEVLEWLKTNTAPLDIKEHPHLAKNGKPTAALATA